MLSQNREDSSVEPESEVEAAGLINQNEARMNHVSPRVTNEVMTVRTAWLFQSVFGVGSMVFSVIAWLIFVIGVVFSNDKGGLSSRNSDRVTKGYFNWHPFCMSAAWLVCLVPSLLSFEVFPVTREQRKQMHGLLNLIATSLAIAGFSVIVDCHQNLSDNGSFKTTHSYSGLLSLILVAIQFTSAVILYGFQLGGEWRARLKPAHKRLGLAAAVCGIATVLSGLTEYTSGNDIPDSVIRSSKATVVFILLSFSLALFALVKFTDKHD